MPLYELEWRLPVVGEDDRVIRTRSVGSTPEKAVGNALAGPGGVMPYEVEDYPAPLISVVDEDGELHPV